MLFHSWRRSYTAQMASPKASTRAWLVLGGPSSLYMQTSGLPVSSSVSATMLSSASSSHWAASLSRGAAQSSGQFSTANMKPRAHTWPKDGISWPSISARSASGRLATAPRMSIASGWKVRSSSSVFTSVSSWVTISFQRRSHSSRKRACWAASAKAGSSGSGSPSATSSSAPSPSSMGRYSAGAMGRRLQITAVMKPSQNSHCGISSPRVRRSSSRLSSSSSSAAVKPSAGAAAEEVVVSSASPWGAVDSVGFMGGLR